MSATHGARVDVVRAVAERLRAGADELQGIGAEAEAAVGALADHSDGPDSSARQGEWRDHRARLHEATERLRRAAAELDEQADDQSVASTAGSLGGLGGAGSLGDGDDGGADDDDDEDDRNIVEKGLGRAKDAAGEGSDIEGSRSLY